MKQQTLAMAADQGASFETHRKHMRRDELLNTMNTIMPWAELCAVIESHYPKRGNGHPPIGLEHMLRIHFVQFWFNLADACERQCTTAPACVALWVLTGLASSHRTRRRCSSSVA
jgi:IS5 family transposase